MAIQTLGQITAEDIYSFGVTWEEARFIHRDLQKVVGTYGNGSSETWNHISTQILNPEQPFSLHQLMYDCYCRSSSSDPPPAWIPNLESAKLTNVGQILEKYGKSLIGPCYKDPISNFADLQKFSISNPEVYWKLVLDELGVVFSVPPYCILRHPTSVEDRIRCPGGDWLPGAVINCARNCLSLNDKRSLDDIAVIWRNEWEENLPVKYMSLKELRERIWLVAHALESLGLIKGAAVAIIMPMNVTAVIIYLAIILAGHVVVSIADSFASNGISTRLGIADAKVVLTQDFTVRGKKKLPLYRRVTDAFAPMAIVVPVKGTSCDIMLRDGDILWQSFLDRAGNFKGIEYPAVEQPMQTFTNILFSSGTTGEPKAIPWTHATPFKAAADAWAHMDIHKGDVVAWPTNLGWMMGPWLIYASLLNGASMALYDGSPLDSRFTKFVQDAKVTVLGVVPSIVRSWKNANCILGLDWSSVRCFSSTGEASNIDEYLWLMGRARYKPVIEYCGGTEIGGGYVTGSLLQSQALATFSTPAMGCHFWILDSNRIPMSDDIPGVGEVALDPFIFGASTMLLNGDHHSVYFEGMPTWNGKILRRHGDEFERTTGGYYRAHGRADDTMNIGGIKVSSAEIERLCNGADNSVLETAAIGVPRLGDGPEELVIAVVLKDTHTSRASTEGLRKAFSSSLQKRLNPLFRVSRVVIVTSLPRTASNKVMRRVLRGQFVQRRRDAKL